MTVSQEQARFAAEHCRGLTVSIEQRDYRSLEGRYDRAFSLGMFEHVGWRNYRTYLRAVSDHLERDGLFLPHTIGAPVSARSGDAWIGRYIFPNS